MELEFDTFQIQNVVSAPDSDAGAILQCTFQTFSVMCQYCLPLTFRYEFNYELCTIVHCLPIVMGKFIILLEVYLVEDTFYISLYHFYPCK